MRAASSCPATASPYAPPPRMSSSRSSMRGMDAVVEYLLTGDPAIRWQVLQDLTDASPDEVAAERARVATEGWGARLLAEQAGDGRWDGGTYRPGWVDESRPFFDAWTATHFSLQSLAEFGLDPASPEAQRAIALVRDNVRWENNDQLYFQGEAEPCINGIALKIELDRKSTRLNSSHGYISYAVFCLKKKR